MSQILNKEPNGVDRACDCVGFECVNADGKNVENLVITWAVQVTRAGGGIGLIGVYTAKDIGKSLAIYSINVVNLYELSNMMIRRHQSRFEKGHSEIPCW